MKTHPLAQLGVAAALFVPLLMLHQTGDIRLPTAVVAVGCWLLAFIGLITAVAALLDIGAPHLEKLAARWQRWRS